VTVPQQPDEERRARQRGRSTGLAVILVVSVAFIGASSAQIIAAVFGLGTTPLPSGPPDSPERRCAAGISRLAQALSAPPPGDAAPRGNASWADAAGIEQSCRKVSGGLDAWAALLRLQAAESELAQAGQSDLEALRREVAAHLPADLR
jgi:hypothetical protein